MKNNRISDIFLILSNIEGESIAMKISDYKFTNNEIENLQKYRDNQTNTRLKFRFVALLMLAKGICIETISIIIGKSKQAIESWFYLYVNKGIESLDSYDYKPKQPYLTISQINQVVIWVKFNNPQKTKEIRDYIFEKFNVDYKIESVRVLLQRYGLKIVKPKLIPGDPPSIEEQERFIEKYTKLREEPESKTLFLDAMHLVHQNIPARCWGDPKYVPVFHTNSGRKRLNILGAYDPETYSIIHDTDEENCNADRVINFLKHILESYKEAKRIYLILDNARYFHARKVSDWLISQPKLNLVFLPPYAPNLNLIERFWRFAKEKLVKNDYCKEYKKFRAKVFQFLSNTRIHKKELIPLMVENFEIISNNYAI